MWVAKTLMFAGSCAGRSELTLVSQRITKPFRTRQFTVRFAPGCSNLLALTLYAAEDSQAPTTGAPSGISLLQDYGQADSLRGDAIQISFNHTLMFRAGGVYLKVYAANADWYAHAVDVDIEIETQEEEV
jgi:hypothetical protein